MTLIFVGFAAFLALFVVLLIPLMVQETQQFSAALPGYQQRHLQGLHLSVERQN